MSTVQAAELLGVTRFHVSKMARDGRIPVAHKGHGRTGVYLFRREDIERLAAGRVA